MHVCTIANASFVVLSFWNLFFFFSLKISLSQIKFHEFTTSEPSRALVRGGEADPKTYKIRISGNGAPGICIFKISLSFPPSNSYAVRILVVCFKQMMK